SPASPAPPAPARSSAPADRSAAPPRSTLLCPLPASRVCLQSPRAPGAFGPLQPAPACRRSAPAPYSSRAPYPPTSQTALRVRCLPSPVCVLQRTGPPDAHRAPPLLLSSPAAVPPA